LHLFNTVVKTLERPFSLSLVGLVDIKHFVSQEARKMGEVGAERHIPKQLIHGLIVQLEYGEQNDSDGIADHHLWVVVEPYRCGNQGKVV
jgi:hypothetical protein